MTSNNYCSLGFIDFDVFCGIILIVLSLLTVFNLNRIAKFLDRKGMIYLPGDSEDSLKGRLIIGVIGFILIALVLIFK